ncbi:molybdopterin molybdotransferase MoeA [Agromyces sp. MMS24-JH15]|uniref:molybdopterin molybdotransferase MoeA n=1 Tax=Agromyces sp. MMS24-JH15 TaxID=3243765 RepID=UPI003749776A
MTGPLVPWDDARSEAHRLGAERSRPGRATALAEAAGLVLAADARAATDLPAIDVSAMDGWVVSGDEPWSIGPPIRMGEPPGTELAPGSARPVTTGGAVPPGATEVLRSEDGDAGGGTLRRAPGAGRGRPGRHVRRRGEELAAGDLLVAVGARLTPPRVSLLAVAGLDEVLVRPRPRCLLIVTGDEVRGSGIPGAGTVRDAYTPSLPALIDELGGELVRSARSGDAPGELAGLLCDAEADGVDLVLTTGGTARGHGDRLREALGALDARIVVPGLRARPGHPTLLARMPGGTAVLGLPGNPLAAFTSLCALLGPFLAGVAGGPVPEPLPLPSSTAAAAGVEPHAEDTLVVPVHRVDGGLEATAWRGAAMLRGLAGADGLLVVAPGGASVRLLPLPWVGGSGHAR